MPCNSPLFVLRDPNAPDFHSAELSPSVDLTNERLTGRQELLRSLSSDQYPSSDRSLQDMDTFRQKAFEVLTSTATAGRP